MSQVKALDPTLSLVVMPEVAETHVVADELQLLISGLYLLRLTYTEDLVRTRAQQEDDADPTVEATALSQVCTVLPQRVDRVYSHGKRIMLRCGDLTLISWLGMAGRWTFQPDNNTKAVLVFGRPHNIQEKTYVITQVLFYNDPRFGKLYARWGTDALQYYIDTHLGPDPLNTPPSQEEWLVRWRQYQERHKNHQVVQAIMDQGLYALHGNYSKSETLFRCRIRPDRLLSQLSDTDLETLRTVSLYVVQSSMPLEVLQSSLISHQVESMVDIRTNS